MENNEKQDEGEKKKCDPPDLPGFDVSLSDSDISSVLNYADRIHISNFETLLTDSMIGDSGSTDDSITTSNDKTVVECQDLARNKEAKTRSGDENTLALRMPSKNLNYNERSEDDGDFSATDGSDYVSNSDEKPQTLKKKTKKAKVNLMSRISQALIDTDMDKPSTSNTHFIVPDTPNSSFHTSNAFVLVPETPETSFEKDHTLKEKLPNQPKNNFSLLPLQLNKESRRLSDDTTNFAAEIDHALSSDTLDLDGQISVSNQANTEDINLPLPSEETTTGKRSWNRRNCCLYCENLVTNFTRHLIRHHQEEPEVLKLMAISNSDRKIQKTKRQAITDDLRNRGNFIHNTKVASNNEGHLITARRANNEQTKPQSPSTFVVCKTCLGTFKRSTFYRHSKKCGTESKHSLARNAISIIPDLQNASKELINNILPRMRNDDISLIAKNDPLIIAYGCRLLKKKKERRSRKVICSRMRDLAHLLKLLREKEPDIKQLQQLFDPKYYECFIDVVKTMSGFNEETGYVEVISIPARIRPEILGCIEILYTNTIMDSAKSTALKDLIKNKLSEFKMLLEANWQWEISSNAEKSRKQKLMTKPQVMPVDEDIKKLITKIHELEETYYKKLKKDVTIVNYENLCEVTIAHVILLDRKRSGDVAESELQYYLNRKIDEIPLEVLESLDDKQKKAMSDLDIFQIPGKRGRPVPVLLTKIMKRNIDILVASRSFLKILSTNKYLFARPLTEEPFDGGKCLNRIKSMCSLRKPEMLTSTGLRHHIATISQVHSKTDEKYTQHLATFLGHDMQVHASNYRLPLQAIQKGVIGSRLLEVEQLSNKQSNLLTEQNEDNQDNDNMDIQIESDKENRTKGENITKKYEKQDRRKKKYKKKITTDEEPDENVDKNEKQERRKKVEKIITTEEEPDENDDENEKQEQSKKVEKIITTDKEPDEHVDKIGKQNRRKKVFKNTRTNEESEEHNDKIGKQNRRKKVYKNVTTDEESQENLDNILKQHRRKKVYKNVTTDEKSQENLDNILKQHRIKKVYKNVTTDEESEGNLDNILKQHRRKKVHKNITTDEESEGNLDNILKQHRRKKVHKNITTDEESEEQVENIEKQNRRKKVHKNVTTDEESNEKVHKIENKNQRKKVYKNITTDTESDEQVDKGKRRKTIHKKWSKDEVDAVMRHLKKFIVMKKNPGKANCEQVLRKEPVLHNRTWMQINTYINNIYKKKP